MRTFLSVVFVAVALVWVEPAIAGHKGSKGYCGGGNWSGGYRGAYYGGNWGRGYCAPYNRGYYGGGYYGGYYAPAISLGFYSTPAYYGGPYYGAPYYSGYGYYGANYAPQVYTGRMIAAPGGSVAVNVQIALQRRGYYRGSIDGVIGPRSRSAIAAFQRAQGLAITGTIDRQVVRALGVG